MKHLININFVLLLFMATSCIKDISFDGEESAPKLVVNGLQIVGETPNLCVEKSRFFMSTSTDVMVKNLSVKLYVNDAFVEDLIVVDSCTLYEDGYYHGNPNYKFNYCYGSYVYQEGDKVRFEVRSDDFDTTEIEVTMPGQPEVLGLDTTRVERVCYPTLEEDPNYYWAIDAQGNPCCPQYHEYYDDATHQYIGYYDTIYPGQLNYCKVHFDLQIANVPQKEYFNLLPVEGFTSGNSYLQFYSTDPVFSDLGITSFLNNEYHGDTHHNEFSDALFQGESYGLSFYADWVYFDPYGKRFTLNLHYIDENYFKYLQTYDAYQDSNLGELTYLIAEPTQIYSNVKNGIGIVGAMGRATRTEIVVHYAL